MADKNQEHPFAQANGNPRSDQESGLYSDELKRQKRIKLGTYIVAFVVFQIIVVTVFGMTFMKVKSPKMRLAKVEVQTLTTGPATSPSFEMSFTTQVWVKNTNFGRYKFDGATADVTYGGATVGQIAIPKGKAGMRSTKKIKGVTVRLSSSLLPNTANLGNELTAGTLILSSTTKMPGKVELMMIMKKKKSAKMDCTIIIDVNSKTLRSLECK